MLVIMGEVDPSVDKLRFIELQTEYKGRLTGVVVTQWKQKCGGQLIRDSSG